MYSLFRVLEDFIKPLEIHEFLIICLGCIVIVLSSAWLFIISHMAFVKFSVALFKSILSTFNMIFQFTLLRSYMICFVLSSLRMSAFEF